MKFWDAARADMQGVTILPDAVTRVPPSLLIRNSVLPVEPHYSRYHNVVMEQMERLKWITEVTESGLAEVNQMPDDADMYLKACLDAMNEERFREMSTKKKRTLLRHVLEVIREAGVPVEHTYDHEDDDQNYIVCYIKCINAFKRRQ